MPHLGRLVFNAGDEVDEAAVANVVLGQFEKVQRSKSKWKIVLKVGGGVLVAAARVLVEACMGAWDGLPLQPAAGSVCRGAPALWLSHCIPARN